MIFESESWQHRIVLPLPCFHSPPLRDISIWSVEFVSRVGFERTCLGGWQTVFLADRMFTVSNGEREVRSRARQQTLLTQTSCSVLDRSKKSKNSYILRRSGLERNVFLSFVVLSLLFNSAAGDDSSENLHGSFVVWLIVEEFPQAKYYTITDRTLDFAVKS